MRKVEAEFQELCDDILALKDKNLIPSARRIPKAISKDAQDIIQFEQVDFEQVAETRQAALQAKNDTNLAKHSGVSKNTQHNVS